MKAIVLKQPYATLAAKGIKTIETRPFPPNGPMRPDGVRGLPGCSLERGERIAIVAGAQRPDLSLEVDPYGMALETVGDVTTHFLYERILSNRIDLPLGAVVCTVTVDDALPIGILDPPEGDVLTRWAGNLTMWLDGAAFPVDDQLPLGDFTPGRWGWLLSDPQPPTKQCEECAAVQSWDAAVAHGRNGCPTPGCDDGRVPADPIPCTGKQGVFELPADIAEQLS